jgi:Domain of Unknown Function (DUF349)
MSEKPEELNEQTQSIEQGTVSISEIEASTEQNVASIEDVITQQDVETTQATVAETEISTVAEETTIVVDEAIEEVNTPLEEAVETVSETVVEEPVEAITEAIVEDTVVAEEASVVAIEEQEQLAEQSQEVLAAIEAEETIAIDFASLDKAGYVKLLEDQLTAIKSGEVKMSDFRHTDEVLKEAKVYFDQHKKADKAEALSKYVAENESEDGFEFKHDALTQQYESLQRQLREIKNHFFQELEKSKDKNLTDKTKLLQELRELIDAEESNSIAAGSSWQDFKKIQNAWKDAGNVNSPHNATLWATYHALIDRYFSNRNIYFELKDLDRKRNLTAKTEIVERIEALAKSIGDQENAKALIIEANVLFDEYKHLGPAPKAEQEALWGRLKVALDVVYDARRSQSDEQKKQQALQYEAKSKIYEALVPHTTFASSSINEWNAKTKEVVALQEQWVGMKGAMLKEEGKELSKKFWAALKVFFNNKGEFFRVLESKREENLKQKTALCEQVEAILASGEDKAANTDTVIELQKQWKLIGQVPEKFKNSLFDRFKKACDGYFNQKRNKNQEIEQEYINNLAVKEMLCSNIEEAAKSGGTSLEQLNEFKNQWAQAGFVPKKDMAAINKRYIGAINACVAAVGSLSPKEKQTAILKNEVAMASTDKESAQQLQRKETDIRRKITNVENEIALLRNNIEFFARSKNSAQLRADVDKKIAVAEKQLNELKGQLKITRENN